MRTRKPSPGSWAHVEANAEAELQRRGMMRVSEPGPMARHCTLIDGVQTPWRESWQEVLSDFHRLHPEPELLELV